MPDMMQVEPALNRVFGSRAVLALGLAMLLPACSPSAEKAEHGNGTAAAPEASKPADAAVPSPQPGAPPAVAILPPKPGLPAVAVVPPATPGAPPSLAVIPPDPNAPPVAVVPPPGGEVQVVIPVAADSVTALPDCSSSVKAHCVLNRKNSGR